MNLTKKEKTIYGLVGPIVLAAVAFIIWCCFWVHFVDNYQLGFVYDKYLGKTERVAHTGWVVRAPWRYSVHSIDLRPSQVSIAANSRILNAKLVQFDPRGLDTFVAWHGREAGDNSAALYEILKSYAFDKDNGRDYPFLYVVSELAPNGISQTALQQGNR
jgi:hypothetical protein